MEFLNRKSELETLNSAYQDGGFVPIYGRRRVGKTRLIQEFMEDKNSVYYLAAQEPSTQQVKEFKELMADHLDDSYLKESSISGWKQLFSYLKQNIDPNKQQTIIIDEVTYIIRRNDSFPSYLQKFWDGFLKDSNTSLVLSGSLIGLMKESILNRSSPVYGRRTAQIKLKPLNINDLNHLFSDFEKTVKVYSLLDGIPKYYEELDLDKSFEEVVNQMLDPDSFFYEEGLFLLTQEFKQLGNYNAILRSISKGIHKAPKIANDIGMETRQIYNYLDKLYEIGLIGKEKPVTDQGSNSRGQRYYIEDNFTRFWFKTIFPERSRIQSKNIEFEDVQNKVKHLTSQVFEQVCRQKIRAEGDYRKVGRWWYKQHEIDLIGINQREEKILFGESKWTNEQVGLKLLKDLEEKSEKVRWKNKKSRKEKYALFSKNGFKKELREESKKRENLELYNLEKLSEF